MRRLAWIGALALSLWGQPLEYQESSAGLESPEWEEGRTELEMADINQDGNPDILSIGDHGSPYINSGEHGIMVWFGDGAGNWTSYMNGNFGYGGIAVGDLNGDGLWDVAYGMHHNYSGNDFGDQLIEAALGDGTGMNWTPWDDGLATAGEDWGMFGTDLADFNNDGLPDIVSISFGCCAGLHVYLNNGDGTWTHSWGFTGGNSGLDVTTGDFNGDGHIDIAASHEYGTVYLGDGTGGFTLADGNLPGSSVGLDSPSAGDVDGDGTDEVAFIYNGAIQVWKWGEGNQWTPLHSGLPQGGYQRVQLADINADGWADAAAASDTQIAIWLGDGAGNWTLAASIPINGDPQAFRVSADADHNGRMDLVVLVEEGEWWTWQNYLRFYRETHPPESLWIRPLYPHGGEVWIGGSARLVRWISAVPGDGPGWVRIELSTSGPDGPWMPVADSLSNGGMYPWVVPQVNSDSCYLRLTLFTPQDTAWTVTSAPFRILSEVQRAETPISPADPPRIRFQGRRDEGLLFQVEARGAFVLSLYAPSGRRVWGRMFRNDHGSRTVWVPTGSLPRGIYLLVLSEGGRKTAGKILSWGN